MANSFFRKKPFVWTGFGVYLPALFLGFVLFAAKFGFQVLNPNHYNWLMTFGDCPTEYLSWQFYRNTPWHFPVVGTMEGYDYPTVTGVGLTGAIPLLAIPFKIISQVLSPDFQYFGYWFLACYLLQGYFSVRLLRGVSVRLGQALSPAALAVGALFLVASPALLWRTGHMNLCAHWLILWSLSLYFEEKTPRQIFGSYFRVIVVTALIHQYILLMQFGLSFAAFWRLWRAQKIKIGVFIGWNVANILISALIWYLIGNFNVSLDTMSIAGFGEYSANLNTFFDSHGEARFLPALPHGEGQFEGFAYLGLGLILMLSVASIGAWWFKTHLERVDCADHWPLWVLAGLLAIYALSTQVTWGQTLLVNGDSLLQFKPFKYIASSFRSSGRFIWPLYYLLMVWGVAHFLRLPLSNTLKMSILALFLGIQLVDIQPMVQRERQNPAYMQADPYAPEKPHFEHWLAIAREADCLVTLPPFDWTIQTYGDYLVFAKIASRHKQRITTGYLARMDTRLHAAYSTALAAQLESGELGAHSRSLFIAGRRSMRLLKKLAEKEQIKVFEYQDYLIGVPLSFKATLDYLAALPGCRPFEIKTIDIQQFIQQHAAHTVIIAAKDEATHGLCADFKDKMREMGGPLLAHLEFRAPYIAVLHQNKVIFETKAPLAEAARFDLKAQGQHGTWRSNQAISVESGGAEGPNQALIRVGTENYSFNRRGLNVVAIDNAGKVVAKAYFDTFLNCEEGEIINISN